MGSGSCLAQIMQAKSAMMNTLPCQHDKTFVLNRKHAKSFAFGKKARI